MDNAQLITVTVEVTDGVAPQDAVDTINQSLSVAYGPGFFAGTTASTPAHAVEGEPYVAGTPGTDVYVGAVTLVQQ